MIEDALHTWLDIQLIDGLFWCIIAMPIFMVLAISAVRQARDEKRQWKETLEDFWRKP